MCSLASFRNARLTAVKLSKSDEAELGRDELEVRREDQDKINKFSKLHQRETALEDELTTKAVNASPSILEWKGLTSE